MASQRVPWPVTCPVCGKERRVKLAQGDATVKRCPSCASRDLRPSMFGPGTNTWTVVCMLAGVHHSRKSSAADRRAAAGILTRQGRSEAYISVWLGVHPRTVRSYKAANAGRL